MKHCNFCGENKPLSEFYTHDRSYGDGHVTKCRACYRAYSLSVKDERKQDRLVRKEVQKLKERDEERLMFRARTSTFNMTSREARNQRIAIFEATLSKLRRELNVWWSVTGGGDRDCPPSLKISLRRLVAKAADDERAIGR